MSRDDGYPMTIDLAHVTRAIDELRDRLSKLDNVAAAALYGSFVRGTRTAASDINLALVVRDDDLSNLVEPLTLAWRAARIDPWIARADELADLCDAFPTRVRDIQRRHRMLVGDDPWTALVISRAALRVRLEQELRNHQLRLRHATVLGDASSQARQLYATAGALRLDLSLIEELAGGDIHHAIEPLALAISKRLGLPRSDVHAVLDYRVHPGAVPGELLATAARVFDRAVHFIDKLEVT